MPAPTRRRAVPCPVCGKPQSEADRPFCSPRCAQIDLGRWFGEAYRVPVPAEPDGDAELDPAPPG